MSPPLHCAVTRPARCSLIVREHASALFAPASYSWITHTQGADLLTADNPLWRSGRSGVIGPLASVKVMWPRDVDPTRPSRRLCGFVAYMERKDAEVAIVKMNNRNILGHNVKVGWGKAVPLPKVPVSNGPAHRVQLIDSGLPFNAQPKGNRGKTTNYSAVAPLGASSGADPVLSRAEVIVQLPRLRSQRQLIHRTIEFVAVHGLAFEVALMKQMSTDTRVRRRGQRQLFVGRSQSVHIRATDGRSANAVCLALQAHRRRCPPLPGHREQFAFLFNTRSADHTYYRWKLFSVLQGDPVDKWPSEPFYM